MAPLETPAAEGWDVLAKHSFFFFFSPDDGISIVKVLRAGLLTQSLG